MSTVVVDGFYAWLLPGVTVFADWLSARAPALLWLARRVGVVRGGLLFAASLNHDAIAMIATDPGWRTLLLLRALLGRHRKLIALQLIPHPRAPGVASALSLAVERWALRRALARGHVLTPGDRDHYVGEGAVPAQRLVLVPWPLRRRPRATLAPARGDVVLCAGRAFCDWPTLFTAARGACWALEVVCSDTERQQVDALNGDGRARVHSEVAPEDFRQLIANAAVLAIVTHEAGVSQGHVRVMDANDAGVAVVATSTESLRGHVLDGHTALLVAPGDAPALRAALDRLMADERERERLRRGAFAHSARWTGEDYLGAIADVLAGRQPRLPAHFDAIERAPRP